MIYKIVCQLSPNVRGHDRPFRRMVDIVEQGREPCLSTGGLLIRPRTLYVAEQHMSFTANAVNDKSLEVKLRGF